jgi:MOSC domain-containing protein YiiM
MAEPGRGRVIALAWCPEAGGPMQRVDTLDVTPDGIPGDRYATGRGSWSRHRTSPLTLVDAAEVRHAAEALRVELDPVTLRRNVVVDGAELDGLVGRRFALGETLLEGERPCDPCRYLERQLAVAGLKHALAECGGLRVRVARGGAIRVGDVVRPE